MSQPAATGERSGAEGRLEGVVGTPASWRLLGAAVLGLGLSVGWLITASPGGPVVAAVVTGVALA
ncbi:MAG: hypothetical protein L0221_13710, partial [Chloroflexi bacterium]|nr:hypothetical protein [Chloroflexota bacterium]